MDRTSEPISDSKSGTKTPVVRGARACTVCRAAKMKCVGAEDGQKQCQRCKRANVECIFEKHRRGRKPGSKLSEASKMLRRLEKGLNSAKMKSHSAVDHASPSFQPSDSRHDHHHHHHHRGDRSDGSYSPSHFASNELPPLKIGNYQNGDSYSPRHGSRSMDIDDDDDEDPDRNEDTFIPAKLIRRENQRNSFFRTILNPEETPISASSSGGTNGAPSEAPSLPRLPPLPPVRNDYHDPITAGLMVEEDARLVLDLVFLRLNPFINLFDPVLHTVRYIRDKCPFLFTTLMMAGCKFFKPEIFKECQKLATDFAVCAFAEAWKSVEVVQAFACLTYWKEPDDNRTWTYIGYACRMAVELNLNKYVPHPPPQETALQKLERRNRERTYLVLFVHDRSLSTQTGRHWMLPEDKFIRHSPSWHLGSDGAIRPEDVIISAFVQLRRIATETTDMFNDAKSSPPGSPTDIDYEVVLRDCNSKLNDWDNKWSHEMERATAEKFHLCFLSFFSLYVRLFLNSFGIQHTMGGRETALSTCCDSALGSLRIISKDFASMAVLSYGQESITVMTAYSAVFLLKLLRSSSYGPLIESRADEIYSVITGTANAYEDAALISKEATNAAYHGRFLRSLVTNDIFETRRNRENGNMPIDPRLQNSRHNGSTHESSPPIYSPHMPEVPEQTFRFPASPHLPAHPLQQTRGTGYAEVDMRMADNGHNSQLAYSHSNIPAVSHATELDAHYWKSMFLELGFGVPIDSPPINDLRHPTSMEAHYQQARDYQQPRMQQGQSTYHQPYHQTQQNYGH